VVPCKLAACWHALFIHCCEILLFAVADQGSVFQLYKGAEGSIRSICCHTAERIVAACGLDRFIRIYDIESRQLLQKVCQSPTVDTVQV